MQWRVTVPRCASMAWTMRKQVHSIVITCTGAMSNMISTTLPDTDDGQDDVLEQRNVDVSADDLGDAHDDWQQSDLVATLPAGLQLDAATMLDLRGTLFPVGDYDGSKARQIAMQLCLIYHPHCARILTFESSTQQLRLVRRT